MIKFFSVLSLSLLFSFNVLQAQHFDKPHTHQVKEGETIEAIAKRYYVTLLDIYNFNPDVKSGLKPNTILIIPKSTLPEQKVTQIKELKGFKTHKTRRKETLYSLAKMYKVTEEDIKKYNKSLYASPLRKGDELQIPYFKITEVVEEAKTTKPYTVAPKEGKWRIAYKFGISIEALQALNPDMGDVLKEGEVINVPNIDEEEQKVVDEQYSYYKVLPKEGFYRLKLKLGLEQTQLETLNPELKELGLKSGMILKIPFSDSTQNLVEGEVGKAINLVDSISSTSTKHIAVMLPFRINRVDFDSISDMKRSIKKDPYLNASLDFYSGVLTAIDSLKVLGISIKLDVYDTKHQVGEVSKIINSNNFETVDAVIGPLTSACFDKVASDLEVKNIPVISPIGANLRLRNNVFQSRSSDELLKDKILNYVKSADTLGNVLVVSDTKNIVIANELKQEFPYAKQVRSRKNKDGEDEFFVTKSDIESALKPGKNIVFLETQNGGFASNVTSILASLIQKEDEELKQEAIEIILMTTNINSAFEGDEINNTHLSKLHFHFASTSKEYSEKDNNSFVNKYSKLYSITPNKRAVKGFDLTMDVVLRLAAFDDLYSSVNQAALTEYVENKFAYKKKFVGGFYNNTVYLVKYDDLTVVEVKQ